MSKWAKKSMKDVLGNWIGRLAKYNEKEINIIMDEMDALLSLEKSEPEPNNRVTAKEICYQELEKANKEIDRLSADYDTAIIALEERQQCIEKLQAQLKAKNAEIKELKDSCKYYAAIKRQRLDRIKLLEAQLKAKDEAHKQEIFKLNDKCVAMRKAKDEAIKLLQEYIKLLGEEIDEIVSYAYSHGWKSTRVEKGKELREEIKQALSLSPREGDIDGEDGI